MQVGLHDCRYRHVCRRMSADAVLLHAIRCRSAGACLQMHASSCMSADACMQMQSCCCMLSDAGLQVSAADACLQLHACRRMLEIIQFFTARTRTCANFKCILASDMQAFTAC